MSISTSSQAPEMDKIIGLRIKQCRQSQKMSQTKLAEAVGLAWQQIQKYEAGKNRVSASMLWRIAEVFDVPVSYFFDDIANEFVEEGRDASIPEWRAEQIVQLYSKLGDAEKDAVFSFLKSVAAPARKREAAE